MDVNLNTADQLQNNGITLSSTFSGRKNRWQTSKKQRDIMDSNLLRPKTADLLEKQRDNMETFRNLLKNSGTGWPISKTTG